MPRKAVIASGVVENVIEVADGFVLPGKTLITLPAFSPVQKDWTWDGSSFAAPPAGPDPAKVAIVKRNGQAAMRRQADALMAEGRTTEALSLRLKLLEG